MVGWTNNEFFAGPTGDTPEELMADIRKYVKVPQAEELIALAKPGEDVAAARKR